MSQEARAYYYPAPPGSLEDIDLGIGVSEWEEVPVRRTATASPWAGGHWTTRLGFTYAVRVNKTISGLDSPGVVRNLFSLGSHLSAGQYVAFCRDRSKLWAGYAIDDVRRGDTEIHTIGNPWKNLNTSGALATGDEVVVMGTGNDPRPEVLTVSSLNIGTGHDHLTLAAGCRFTHRGTVIVFQRHFLPLAQLAPDHPPIITSTRGVTYTLDMTLHLDQTALAATASAGEAVFRGTDDAENLVSFEEHLGLA